MGGLFSSCFQAQKPTDSSGDDQGVNLNIDRASPSAVEKRQKIAQATEERLKQVCVHVVSNICTN